MSEQFRMHDEDQVSKDIAEAVRVAVEAMPTPLNQEELVKNAMFILRNERSQAIWKLMGFDATWGRWEFDRTNGRNSPVAKWFDSVGSAPLQQFMNEQLGEILAEKLEEFRKKIRPQIIKHMDDQLKQVSINTYELSRRFESVMKEEIESAIETRRQEIKDAVVKNLNIDPENYREPKRR